MIVTAADYSGTALVNAEVALAELVEVMTIQGPKATLVDVQRHLKVAIEDLKVLRLALLNADRIVMDDSSWGSL